MEEKLYTLVDEKSEILFRRPALFDWENPQENPEELEKLLVENMVRHEGIGLSANQIGIPLKVFSMYFEGNPIVVFNPRLTEYSEEKDVYREGCLSYPGLSIAITRSKFVEVEFEDSQQERRGGELSGWAARVFQHEMAHMMGQEFFKDVSNFTITEAFKKRKFKLRKMRANAKKIKN